MNIVKKIVLFTLMVLSLNAFSQDYVFSVLKPGVKNDLQNLILNPDNFVREIKYDNYGNKDTIFYLKYTSAIVNVFKKYGATASSNYSDNDYVENVQDDLISIGNHSLWNGKEYFQCVQFAQVISNAGTATNIWKTGGTFLNKSMNLRWKLIAIFNYKGLYDGSDNGHVALAIASNSKGVYVIDQNWAGSRDADYGKVAVHLIPWDEAKKYALVTKPSS